MKRILVLLSGAGALGAAVLAALLLVQASESRSPSIPMVPIEAGTFEMGCTDGQSGCRSYEEPSHEVMLTRDFLVGQTPVTQAQFEAVMGYNPSSTVDCPDCPVELVSWDESAAFANTMSASNGLEGCYACIGTGVEVECEDAAAYKGEDIYDCPGYRLPTEAEWEYAARCGEDFLYAGSNVLAEVGWYADNSDDLHPVAQKSPNGCDVYDMSGNVWEWMQDRSRRAYTGDPVTDPLHTGTARSRVLRGGAGGSTAAYTRISKRYQGESGPRLPQVGLRLARTAPAEPPGR